MELSQQHSSALPLALHLETTLDRKHIGADDCHTGLKHPSGTCWHWVLHLNTHWIQVLGMVLLLYQGLNNRSLQKVRTQKFLLLLLD